MPQKFDDLVSLGQIMAEIQAIKADVHSLKESQMEDDIERRSNAKSHVIYRWVTSAILAALVSMAGYFFAMSQDHEGRITRAESAMEQTQESLHTHATGRGHDATRDDISALGTALTRLTETVRQSTLSQERARADLTERLEAMQSQLRRIRR